MQDQDQNWETLIASRMRPCVALKTEDAAKRNSEMATKRWRKNHMEHYLSKQKAAAREVQRGIPERDEPDAARRWNNNGSFI